MVKETEHETEILLGNKQLLGIFFVVAVLLGVAFAGGYMIGHGATKKSIATAATPAAAPDTAASGSAPAAGGGETHSVGADTPASEEKQTGDTAPDVAPLPSETTPAATHEKVNATLNTRARKHDEQASPSEEIKPTPAPATGAFTPQPGQTFLQVAAVGRDEAEAVADVLHKKGFRAHAIQKPGNAKIYRVLIGPIRDTGDLSSTRDSLRHAGFREVIVQRY